MTEPWEECQPSVICCCHTLFVYLSISVSCSIRKSFHNVYHGRAMAWAISRRKPYVRFVSEK